MSLTNQLMTHLNKLAAVWQLSLNHLKWDKESGAQRLLTSSVSGLGGLCCKWGDNDARLKPFDCYIYFWADAYAVELKILKAGKIKFQPHQLSILHYCAQNNNQHHLVGLITTDGGKFWTNFYTARELMDLEASGEFELVV